MATYEIRNRGTGTAREIDAQSYEAAVSAAYALDYPTDRSVRLHKHYSVRVTGTAGRSGVFQVYAPLSGSASTAIGPDRGYHATTRTLPEPALSRLLDDVRAAQ